MIMQALSINQHVFSKFPLTTHTHLVWHERQHGQDRLHGVVHLKVTSSVHCIKADSRCQKRSDQRPATCCASRARDSCRFTMYTSWRPAALRNHGTVHLHKMRREENRLQLQGSEFLLVNCMWVLEPENFPPSIRASQGKRLWYCWGFQDYWFAFSAKDWSYCQNLEQIYLRKPP